MTPEILQQMVNRIREIFPHDFLYSFLGPLEFVDLCTTIKDHLETGRCVMIHNIKLPAWDIALLNNPGTIVGELPICFDNPISQECGWDPAENEEDEEDEDDEV